MISAIDIVIKSKNTHAAHSRLYSYYEVNVAF
jgi:hypothetical protein